MNKKILIIIIAVVVVIGAAAFVLLSGGNEDAVDKQPNIAYYVPGEYFVTNVSGSKMLLKTTIALGFDEKTIPDATTLKNLNSAMRDIINRELRTLTEEDIANPDILDTLKQRLLAALQSGMAFDNLLDIKFNDFVAQ